MAEIVPFYATEIEHKSVDTLPTDTVKVDDLLSAVPKFRDVVSGDLLLQWARLATPKDDIIEIHLYKKDRKEIFEWAHAAIKAAVGDSAAADLARAANEMLDAHPWWPDFEAKLLDVLSEHFRGSTGRVGYHEEVDSWSVTMYPGNAALLMWSEDHLTALADKLWAKIKG